MPLLKPVRVEKKFEEMLRRAKMVQDIINSLRPLNRQEKLWGRHRVKNKLVIKEFLAAEFITPGASLIHVLIQSNVYMKSGRVKIIFFLHCDKKKISKGDRNGSFRTEIEIGKKNPGWDDGVGFFGKCRQNSYSLEKAIFG